MNMSSKKSQNNKKILQTVKQEIAGRLRQIRKDKNLTQRQMGEALGINFQHVSKYERAEFIPTFENLIKLIEHFSVNINWLLTGVGPLYVKKTREYSVVADHPGMYLVKDDDGTVQEVVDALLSDDALKAKVFRLVSNYIEMKQAAEDLKYPSLD